MGIGSLTFSLKIERLGSVQSRDKKMSLLAIPIAVMVMAIMDYVAWQVLVAVAGPFAILYMALIVVLEVSALSKGVSNNSGF